MAIWAYTAESIVLRVQKLHKYQGDTAAELPLEIMQTYVHSAADKINVAGRDALMGFAEGDELKMMLMGMKRFTKVEPFNCKESRRKIAGACIDKNEYCF